MQNFAPCVKMPAFTLTLNQKLLCAALEKRTDSNQPRSCSFPPNEVQTPHMANLIKQTHLCLLSLVADSKLILVPYFTRQASMTLHWRVPSKRNKRTFYTKCSSARAVYLLLIDLCQENYSSSHMITIVERLQLTTQQHWLISHGFGCK